MVVGSVELVPLVDAVGLLGELDVLYPGFDDWEPYRTLYPERSTARNGASRCTSYLLRSGGTTVLVDTGVGPAGLWGWTPEWEEGLLPALAEAGVAPDGIDIVFLTHLHVDHVGWNTDRNGELVFPNARYVAHRDGVAFARTTDRPHVARTIAVGRLRGDRRRDRARGRRDRLRAAGALPGAHGAADRVGRLARRC